MTFYADMGTATMVARGDHVRAVGWLHPLYPYTEGKVPSEVLMRLREFARLSRHSAEALALGSFMGGHKCEFCVDFRAGGDFGVPDGPILFVAPEMIVHYVEQHGYRPPAEFMSAVRNSPLPGTQEYSQLAEPFRILHEKATEPEPTIARAARWTIGGGDSIRNAARTILSDDSPATCELIRQEIERFIALRALGRNRSSIYEGIMRIRAYVERRRSADLGIDARTCASDTINLEFAVDLSDTEDPLYKIERIVELACAERFTEDDIDFDLARLTRPLVRP